MTRVRRHPQGRTVVSQMPPLDLMAEPVRKLAEEYQRLFSEHDAAHNEHSTLLRNRNQDDHDARQADAAAAVTAARTGQPIDATAHRTALDARRKLVQQRAGALTEALEQVARDLSTARDEWQVSGEPAAAVRAARSKLGKTADAFQKAVREAALAIGVDEWVAGYPFDDSADLAATDVDPRLRGQKPAHAGDAVDSHTLIDLITNI